MAWCARRCPVAEGLCAGRVVVDVSSGFPARGRDSRCAFVLFFLPFLVHFGMISVQPARYIPEHRDGRR